MTRGGMRGTYSRIRGRDYGESRSRSYSRGYSISKDRAQGGARDKATISDNIAVGGNSDTESSNLDIISKYKHKYSKYTIQLSKKV